MVHFASSAIQEVFQAGKYSPNIYQFVSQHPQTKTGLQGAACSTWSSVQHMRCLCPCIQGMNV